MWPGSPASRADLLQPINNFSTILVGDLQSTDIVIPVTSVQGIPTGPGLISIDFEVIRYSGVATNPARFVGCTRGVDGTQRRSHSNGSRVEMRWVAGHHNTLADVLFALQEGLGGGALDATQQYGSGSYASLAEMLQSTLPRLVPCTGTTWSVPHARRRLVGVQLYETTGANQYQAFEAPIQQQVDPVGTSMVTAGPFGVFPQVKNGFMVII